MSTIRNQHIWNVIFLLLFGGPFVLGLFFLIERWDLYVTSINWFDFMLIILATFRLTRLLVYDKIMEFFRDWFCKIEERKNLDGTTELVRTKYERGPLRTVSDLLDCPWCTSLWFSLFVTFFYFLHPLFWFVILVLAVAGVAAVVQVTANLVGWKAELAKLEALERKGRL